MKWLYLQVKVEVLSIFFFQISLQVCKSQSQYCTLNKIFIFVYASSMQQHIIVSGTLFLLVLTAYDVT